MEKLSKLVYVWGVCVGVCVCVCVCCHVSSRGVPSIFRTFGTRLGLFDKLSCQPKVKISSYSFVFIFIYSFRAYIINYKLGCYNDFLNCLVKYKKLALFLALHKQKKISYVFAAYQVNKFVHIICFAFHKADSTKILRLPTTGLKYGFLHN